MNVRALVASDLSQLLDLYGHLLANDVPRPDSQTIDAVWSEALANPRIRYFGGFDGDQLVAAATHRRKGWGRAVLQQALSFAWSANCYKVMLLSGRNDDGVLRFYRAAGFDADAKRGYVARAVS
jgi:GNAT superfamily N-acetyltransferase